MAKMIDELQAMKLAELKAYAKEIGLKGYSSLKKQELVDMITSAEGGADAPAEAAAVEEEASAPAVEEAAEEKKAVPYSEMDLKDITPEIAWKAMFGGMKYHSYYTAAVNLYGVIRKNDMAALIKRYAGETLSEAEIMEDIKNNISFSGQYCIYGDYVVSDVYRESNMVGVLELIEASSKYSRYYPETKDDFLRYENGRYYEDTPALEAVEKSLRQNFGPKLCEETDILDEFIDNLHMHCVNQVIAEKFEGMVEEYGLKFGTEKQKEKFFDQVIEVYRNTRLWNYNGHTKAEIDAQGSDLESSKSKSFEDVKKEFVLRAAAMKGDAEGKEEKKPKVGRNELCPCGSGLKYKKCCGKNA